MSRLDFMRDKNKRMPAVANPEAVLSMRIWHCKYANLDELSRFCNLEELVIATFPDKTFDVLSGLKNLRYLSILHMPKISDLSPISKLHNLESLSLSTSASWDASRKITKVTSIEPIADLPLLKHLELFGVCPADKSLKPLEKIKTLESARFSQYPEEEMNRFYKATGMTDKFNPESSFG
ncbi:MAG TPA: hypothetical protein PLH49_13365 [Chitinophagaceae bacterium]|nr:hypothetical protein [Cyclobacteriaceae bacterium]HND96750.1 hypothetical protein [Chitinophagaceae bacterium]